jgi:DNA-binding sugar fermentation-stimulating protein
LGIEEQLIDATTEEGRRHLEELEKRASASALEKVADTSEFANEKYDDPA